METLLFIGGIGTTEMLVIAGIALLFFGGAKLPELMRGAGRGIREFKSALNEVDEAVKGEADEKRDAVEEGVAEEVKDDKKSE